MVNRDHAEIVEVVGNLLTALAPYKKSLAALPGVDDAYFDVFVAGLIDRDGEGACEFALQSVQLTMLAKFGIPIRFTVSIGHE